MDSGCSGCSPRCNVLRPGVRVLLDRVAPGRHRDGGTDSDAQFCRRGFGPALAGAVVTWLDSESVRAWARQIVRWRVAPRWYLAAFVLPLLVVGLASVAITLLGTTVDPTVLSGRLSLVFGSYVFVALIGGETRNRAGEGSPSRGSRNGTRRSRPRSSCRCRLGVLAPSSAGRGSERCLQFRMARRGDPRDHPSHHQYRGLRVPPDVDLQRNRERPARSTPARWDQHGQQHARPASDRGDHRRAS